MEKKYTETGTNIDNVKKINEAFGLSYNDAIALLAQASQVQTTDEIDLEWLRHNAERDSTQLRMNQVYNENYFRGDKFTDY